MAVKVAALSQYPPKDQTGILANVKRIEKKTFPRTEVFDFDAECKKSNTQLFVAQWNTGDDQTSDQTVGYLVSLRMRRIVLLHKICVEESHRRHGIGKQLLEHLIRQMEQSGSDSIQLWVDTQREPARKLYLSLGFVATDTVQDYYGLGRHGTRMVLHLAV